MPTPHLTPQISAGAMRKLTTDLLRLWRSEGRGGVTLTKSRAQWVLEATVASPTLALRCGTYAAFRHTNGATVPLGNFSPGTYQAQYGGGAFRFFAVSWDTNEQIMRVDFNGGNVTAPDNSRSSTLEEAEQKMRDKLWSPTFSHAGGPISVTFFDNPYGDNSVTFDWNFFFHPNFIASKPPLFGIASSLPRLAVEDCYTNGPFTGWGAIAPIPIPFSMPTPSLLHVELDFEMNVPAHNFVWGALHTDRLLYGDWPGGIAPNYPTIPPVVLQAPGTGALGDMILMQTTTTDHVEVDGESDTLRYFIPFWVDGMYRRDCYFACTAIRILSVTPL